MGGYPLCALARGRGYGGDFQCTAVVGGFHGFFCDPGWLAAKDEGWEGGDGGVSTPSSRICRSTVSSSESLFFFFSAQIMFKKEKKKKKKSRWLLEARAGFSSKRKQPSRREPGVPSPSPGSPHQVCCALNNSYFLRN